MQKRILFICLFIASVSFGQNTIEQVLQKYNKGYVAYIQVADAQKLNNALFLDAREPAEYAVSHIKDAKYVGYTSFDPNAFNKLNIDKNTPIVVYCSVGVRSEQVGDRLQRMGYTNVRNLYGGIFEWKNNKGVVVDSNAKKTNKVHCYSEEWSKYLTNGDCAYN